MHFQKPRSGINLQGRIAEWTVKFWKTWIWAIWQVRFEKTSLLTIRSNDIICCLVNDYVTLSSNVLTRKVISQDDLKDLDPICFSDPRRKGKKLVFYAIDYSDRLQQCSFQTIFLKLVKTMEERGLLHCLINQLVEFFDWWLTKTVKNWSFLGVIHQTDHFQEWSTKTDHFQKWSTKVTISENEAKNKSILKMMFFTVTCCFDTANLAPSYCTVTASKYRNKPIINFSYIIYLRENESRDFRRIDGICRIGRRDAWARTNPQTRTNTQTRTYIKTRTKVGKNLISSIYHYAHLANKRSWTWSKWKMA